MAVAYTQATVDYMRMHPRRNVYPGWHVLTAVSGINFANGATTIGVLTVFILPFADEFGWSRTEIAGATSLGALLGAATALLTGRLTDSFGARIPLVIGGLMVVVAMVNLAAMQTLLWFYLAFGLARLADQGFIQPPSAPAIAKWFLRLRGRALATLFFVTSVGGVILPLVVQLTMDNIHWRAAWLILAGVMVVFGVIPTAILVRRQPEDMGLAIDGDLPLPIRSGDSPTQPSGSAIADEEHWTLKEAVRHPALALILVSTFAVGIASSGVGLHLVPFLVQQGLSATLAVGAVSIGFLASGISNLVWALVADRYSTRYLLALNYALRAGTLLLLLRTDTPAMAYLYAALQGFTEGGIRTLGTLMLANYYGRRRIGTIFGVSRAVQVAGFALGPLIAALAFDLTLSYSRAFTAFFLLSLLGTGLIMVARPPSRSATPE
ncbi:MAG: MFS transporter [Chloroflexi bacterium]|nr:MFS transporter [Chloroflexota bacterium]